MARVLKQNVLAGGVLYPAGQAVPDEVADRIKPELFGDADEAEPTELEVTVADVPESLVAAVEVALQVLGAEALEEVLVRAVEEHDQGPTPAETDVAETDVAETEVAESEVAESEPAESEPAEQPTPATRRTRKRNG